MEVFFNILLMGGILIVILYVGYYMEESKNVAWQKFAQANGLTFVPGQWFGNKSYVKGRYKERQVTLETIHKGSGKSRTTYTRLYLGTTSDQIGQDLTTQFPAGTFLPVQEVEKLLNPTGLAPFKGEFTIRERGRSWTYEQRGRETKTENLQALLDSLVELSNRYRQLLPLGGDLVKALRKMNVSSSSIPQAVVQQLLVDIAAETAGRLKRNFENLYCTHCLTGCTGHKFRLSLWYSVVYYGCRMCGQSRQFLTSRGSLIAVLDCQMETDPVERWDGLRVNWLSRRSLFDFKRVEIIQASDEEVERFAVQVGNDTDPWRKPRYRQMTCLVSAHCQLSENTLRILERMFGEVKVG